MHLPAEAPPDMVALMKKASGYFDNLKVPKHGRYCALNCPKCGSPVMFSEDAPPRYMPMLGGEDLRAEDACGIEACADAVRGKFSAAPMPRPCA